MKYNIVQNRVSMFVQRMPTQRPMVYFSSNDSGT